MVLMEKFFLPLTGYLLNFINAYSCINKYFAPCCAFGFKHVLRFCLFILVVTPLHIQPSLVNATNTIDKGAIVDNIDDELIAKLRKKMN